MSKPANINDKLDQLKAQVDWFYSDDFDLAQAVANYESAVKLAKQIETDLKTLKNNIEIITQDFTGQ